MNRGGDRADLPYSYRHPIILPKEEFIIKLILHCEHERLLHAGCERLSYQLSEGDTSHLWLGARDLLCKCIRCNRAESKLPDEPIISIKNTNSSTFFSTGVDYARLFLIKEWTRSKTTTKTSVYVCVLGHQTLAVHLEVTRDLITESFLNCLNRFLACRGRCRKICSDNGTNFPLSAWNEPSRIPQKERKIYLSSHNCERC